MSDELMHAVERGYTARVRELLMSGASPHEDDWGFSILDAAIARRDEAMVKLLVQHGARLDVADDNGRGRLHKAASGGDHPEGVRLLLRIGFDPNAVDDCGWTPLHCAGAHGYPHVAEVLLNACANPAARRQAGLSPADLARANGHHRWPSRQADE